MTPLPTPPPRPGAGHGLKWLLEAWRMLRRWPAVFLPMGLIVGIVSLVPYLGGFALLILGPVFLAGIVTAAETARRGKHPAIHQLFAMFENNEHRNEALKLCLPLVLGKFVAAMVIAGALIGAVSQSGMDPKALEGHPEKLLSLLAAGDMAPWLLLAIAIVLLAWTFTALAIPAVALKRRDAFAAMASGFRRVWHGIGAWVVALVLLFAVLMLVTMLLMLTRSMAVVQVGLYTVLYAALGPLLHAAWRDSIGADASGDDEDQDDTKPPAPPTPPPPSGVLEA